MRLLLLVAAVVGSSGACSTASEAHTLVPMVATLLPAPVAPLIGSLQTRDQTLNIYATGFGPRYVVTTRDGRVMSQLLTQGELAARHRELHDALQTSTANFIDARVDHRVLDRGANQPVTADSPF
jgi:hypothetical protein